MAAQPPDLFRGVSANYVKYRPVYPAELFPLLVERFNLDGSGTLLDLGCGPGVLTIPLRPYFTTVYGLDPQPEMLEQAREQAKAAGVEGIRWLTGSSTDLPLLKEELGSLRLTTTGRSFHWTDRPATLDVLYDLTEPGGGVAIIGTHGFWDSTAPWKNPIMPIIKRSIGIVDHPGQGRDGLDLAHDEIMAQSRFERKENLSLSYPTTATLESILGYIHSTSFCAPPRLGERLESFDREISDALLQIEPTGVFADVVNTNIVLGWKA